MQEETLTRDTVIGHRGLEQIHAKDVAPQNRIARNSATISPNASTIRSGEGGLVIACGALGSRTSVVDQAFAARYQPVSASFAAN